MKEMKIRVLARARSLGALSEAACRHAGRYGLGRNTWVRGIDGYMFAYIWRNVSSPIIVYVVN